MKSPIWYKHFSYHVLKGSSSFWKFHYVCMQKTQEIAVTHLEYVKNTLIFHQNYLQHPISPLSASHVIKTPNYEFLGLELAIDPPPPRGNFAHYDFLKRHNIRHKMKDVTSLRVAALMCNITLYTLPPEIALSVPDNVSTMTCSHIFAC